MIKIILVTSIYVLSLSALGATECFNFAEATIFARLTKMGPNSSSKKLEIGYYDDNSYPHWKVIEKIKDLNCNNNISAIDLVYCKNSSNNIVKISRFEKVFLNHNTFPMNAHPTIMKGYSVELLIPSSYPDSKIEHSFDTCVHNASE